MEADNFVPMDSDEYKRVIAALGLTLAQVAVLFNQGGRTVTRHANDEARIPLPETILLRAMRKNKLTIDEILQLRLSRSRR